MTIALPIHFSSAPMSFVEVCREINRIAQESQALVSDTCLHCWFKRIDSGELKADEILSHLKLVHAEIDTRLVEFENYLDVNAADEIDEVTFYLTAHFSLCVVEKLKFLYTHTISCLVASQLPLILGDENLTTIVKAQWYAIYSNEVETMPVVAKDGDETSEHVLH